jgi:putative transposase
VRHLRLCRSAWEDFIPFLDYDAEIRAVICSTNAIESLDARYRRAVKARGHFPTVMWNPRALVKAGRLVG